MDVLSAVQLPQPDRRSARAPRRVHHRLLDHPHRAQLHRHDPHDAREGGRLDAPAAVRVVDLRDEHHPGPRHAGARDGAPLRRRRQRARLGPVRPRARRRPGALPAPLLVLLAPGGLHHGPAGDGRRERGRRHLLAQEPVLVQGDRLLVARHRVRGLPHVGTPHVRRGDEHASTPGAFGVLSMLVAIFSAIKVFNWTWHADSGARSR